MTYREYHYRSADGRLDLFARDYPAANANDDLSPLLMMHGLTRNSADFEPLIEQLGTGRRIIVPDQRGRGLSQNDPDPSNYRPDRYTDDMWKLLDNLGIDKVVCIGTSMGGLISMLMGAQIPDRIIGIVLNDVGPEVSQEGLDRIRNYVGGGEPMANWDEAALRCASINATALDGFTEADWMAFAKRTCRELSDRQIEFAYDPAISVSMADEEPATVPPDLWALWEALTAIPVLAIRRAKSDILEAATVAQMHRRHPENFESLEIDGRGHAPILDEPVAVESIVSFLERQP
nr:alpha/beta hydrolase [Aurantiacibacter sp. 219JJ12-13]MDP5263516.1 alpha/beta hydrolase [Aurantiacibacter sp. 219JJ12-13]